MIVIDANIAAKWLLPERGQAEADALLRDASGLLAPSIIRMEVAAAITRRVRQGKMPVEEAREHYQNWLGLLRDGVIGLVPDEDLLDQAVALSMQIKHALQDCLYLAAAQQYRVALVTADETFHRRASPAFPAVQLLAGVQPN